MSTPIAAAVDCRPGACEVGAAPADTPGVRPAVLGLIALLAGCALAGLTVTLANSPIPAASTLVAIGVLAGLGVTSWLFPVRFGPRMRLELDTTVTMAAVLLVPVGIAGLVAGLGPLAVNLRRREPWTQATFNAAQSCLQGLLGGAIVLALGWKAGAPDFAFPHPLPPALLAAAAMYLLNTALVAAIVSLQERHAFVPTWRAVGLHLDRTEIAAHCSQIGLGILAAAIVGFQPWLLGFLLLPAAAVYGTLNHHTRLRILAEDRLIHQATHDPLTDLPNRAVLVARMEEALARNAGEPAGIAVLMLDLDHFKAINDTHGHLAGDRVLKTVADRLTAVTRASDTVARLGGDEFTLLLDPVRHVREAEEIAARITAAIANPIDLGACALTLTSSIGIAVPRSETTAGALLHEADVALYQAKGAGRDRFALFDPEHIAA